MDSKEKSALCRNKTPGFKDSKSNEFRFFAGRRKRDFGFKDTLQRFTDLPTLANVDEA
jgi:hypothetical protein